MHLRSALAVVFFAAATMESVVVAQDASTADSAPPRTPRLLTAEDLEKLRRDVQSSKARNAELARRIELQRQEQARQWKETQRLAEAEAARLAEENALADAEFERERARKAAAWNAAAIERSSSTDTTVQAKQIEAARRNGEVQQDKDLAERQPATSPTEQIQSGKPLRFVLIVSMKPRPGDTVNPTCYSYPITRGSLPGWGLKGFIPSTSYTAARTEVAGMKSQFFAACRETGREIDSEGNFRWEWNEATDGDEKVSRVHAEAREDVTVRL